MKMKVQTKDLQVGDVVGSGETIAARPYVETHPMYGKSKMRVTLRKGCEIKTRVWGKFTTISIDRPEVLAKCQ